MGIALSISILSSTLLTAAVSVSPGGIGRILVADSYAEFSDVQGQDGWWYGYFEGKPPFDPDDFEEFPKFRGSRPEWGVWEIDPHAYWTKMWRFGCQPNGEDSPTPVIHWAVRRWVSGVDGPLHVVGSVSDLSRGGGNGVVARILVDGMELWSHVIHPGDADLFDFDVPTCVVQGSSVDLVVDPRGSSAFFDATHFTARMFWLPKGDTNCDCAVDALDVEPFLLALFDPDAYARRFPDCDLMQADINQDGSVDALDIEPFIELLFP